MRNYFAHVPLLQKWITYFLLQPQRKKPVQHIQQSVKPIEKSVETVYQMKLADLQDFQRKAFVGNYFAGPNCFFNPALFTYKKTKANL